MAYIVTRNKTSGYVSFVEKKRVPVAGNKTSVRNVDYICGLGIMSQAEFEEFRGWAHGITCQETRKATVLACPKVVKKETETRARVAAEHQKGTTVKKARKAKTAWSDKSGVRKHYPVPKLEGYRGKTHTQIMIERKKQEASEKEMKAMADRKKRGIPEIVEPRVRPPSKFSLEGIAFSRRSKKMLARERVR